MKCKAKKAFFAGKNDIYHRWKEVKKLNGKSKNQYYNRKPQWLSCQKAFFAGKNDIYHRWKEVKKLNGKSKNQYYNRKPQWLSCRRCG